jgi:hypothetical protein
MGALMVTSPSEFWIILSAPLGPREDRRVRERERAAAIFCF